MVGYCDYRFIHVKVNKGRIRPVFIVFESYIDLMI